MAVIGVDAHKRSHTLVAVDELGRKLGERTVGTTSDGHLQAVQWAAQWPQVRFALEDCRHLTRRLEGDLLRAGHQVVRVPTRLMPAARRSSRQVGKSDHLLARSGARDRESCQAREASGANPAGGVSSSPATGQSPAMRRSLRYR